MAKKRVRANGEGTIFKRTRTLKNGKTKDIWVIEYYDALGEQHTKYAKTQGEAKIILRDALSVIPENTLVKSDSTVEDYCVKYMSKKRSIQSSTRETYQICIDHYILPYIGDIKVHELTEDDLEKMFTKLTTCGSVKPTVVTNEDGTKQKVHMPLKPSVIKKVKSILNNVLKIAKKEHKIATVLSREIETPSLGKPRPKFYTQDEVNKILCAAQDTDMYLPCILMIGCGLRRGELLGLRWNCIDLKNKTAMVEKQITVLQGKADIKDTVKTESSFRTVGLPKDSIGLLKKAKATREKLMKTQGYLDEGLVVCQANGKHWHPRNFARRIDKVFKEAEVKKLSPHALRHTFTTLMLANGAYLADVQNALGHTNPETTLIYAHALPQRQQEIAARANNILNLNE